MILDTIAAATKIRVEKDKAAKALAQVRMEALALGSDTGFSFKQALGANGISLICEVKKASPTRGVIDENFDYLQIAADYENAGAAAISVLTEPEFFMGSPDYLQAISKAVSIPTLRKDFIVDPYQIYEARLLGASAVLLICRILDEKSLGEYIALAHSLGLSALVEAHTEDEVNLALAKGAGIIGVNNRDLQSFEVRLETSINLRKLVPSDRLFVSESGIKTAEDIARLKDAGVDAVLIGESLMTAKDKGNLIHSFKGD